MRGDIRGPARFVLEQLAGAGFASALFALFLLHGSGYDLYRWSEAMNGQFLIGLIFYGYGLACSLGIALLGRLFPRLGLLSRILLYMAAGYAYFLARGTDIVMVIAGTVAAVFALAFFAGTRMAASRPAMRWGLALAAPLALLVLSHIDYTVKKGWTESATPGRYEASFDSFDGKHEIPIEAERGQRVVFRVSLDNANGGGHGMHVLNGKGEYAGMRELGDERYAFEAERSGTYRIVLTGDNLQGSYRVEWQVETDGGAGGA